MRPMFRRAFLPFAAALFNRTTGWSWTVSSTSYQEITASQLVAAYDGANA